MAKRGYHNTVLLWSILSAGAILGLVCYGSSRAAPAGVSIHATVAVKAAAVAAADGGCTEYGCLARANLTRYSTDLVQRMTDFKPFEKESLWWITTQTQWDRFDVPITCPPDRPLTKYGSGDGSKLLCKLDNNLDLDGGSKCIIYSLGSNGDYQFEEAMLSSTSCDIHTFDCTYNGSSIHPQRHHYHQWCIGRQGGNFRSWANITQTLGHTQVDLLKMDIEGYEYSVLASFEPSDNLPKELAMEVHLFRYRTHAPKSSNELALFFLHLANLGYAAYSKEVNVIAPYCCSEFSFLRVSSGMVASSL